MHDALSWARRLRGQLGAVPISGEVLPEFRWVLFHVGTAESGGKLELLDPPGDGFVQRFLDAHGEGAHHITFMVDDVASTVTRVRELGARVVGEDYGHAPWEEAFVFPDAPLGVVVQLARSDRSYPSPAELLASRVRRHECYPNSRRAGDVTWWHPVWETPAGPAATLREVDLGSLDPSFSQALFEGVLEGERSVDGAVETYTWQGGLLRVRPSAESGVKAVRLADGDPSLTIGEVTIGP